MAHATVENYRQILTTWDGFNVHPSLSTRAFLHSAPTGMRPPWLGSNPRPRAKQRNTIATGQSWPVENAEEERSLSQQERASAAGSIARPLVPSSHISFASISTSTKPFRRILEAEHSPDSALQLLLYNQTF